MRMWHAAIGDVRAFRRALAVLLTLDIVVLGLLAVATAMVARGMIEEVPFMLKVSGDGTLAEVVNYGKWLTIALCLRSRARARADGLALMLAWVFAIVLVDDALQIHETLGDLIGEALGLGAAVGLEDDDVGELVGFGLLGIVVVALVVAGFRRARPEERPLGVAMLAVLAALVAFGVFLDAVAAVVERLDLVEDAGVMLFGSVGGALAWAGRGRRARERRG